MFSSCVVQTGVELELQESMPLLEWFANNYKNFGATLEIVTDRSQEGAQFVKGFGGIGGMIELLVSSLCLYTWQVFVLKSLIYFALCCCIFL